MSRSISDFAWSRPSLAKTCETLVNSGLHYETPLPNAAQHMVAAEVQNMLKEFREAEQKHIGYVQLRDSEVLRALVFMVRMAYGRTSGRPKSRAFVDFLLAQFPEKPAGVAAPEERGRILQDPAGVRRLSRGAGAHVVEGRGAHEVRPYLLTDLDAEQASQAAHLAAEVG